MNIDIAPPNNNLAQLGLRSTSGNGGRIYFGTGGSYTGSGANAAGVIAYHGAVAGGFEFRTNNSTANDPDAVQFTKFVIAGDGKIAAGTTSPTNGTIMDLNGTGTGFSSLLIPRDTTALRPAGVNGMIRYNTTTLRFEVYEGQWQNITSAGGAGDNLGNHTATVPIIGVVGTAGGPGYTFSGDTDTGLYHPAANTIAYTTGTTERMRVDNLGNVGIGSAAPTVRLDVSGAPANNVALLSITNTANNGYNGGFNFLSPNLGATNNAVINIGQSLSTNNAMQMNFFYAGAGDSHNSLGIGGYNQGMALIVNASGAVGIGGISVPQSALDVNGNMSIGTYAGVTGAPTNGLIVSGNVGIGTNTPKTLLHVGSGPDASGNTGVWQPSFLLWLHECMMYSIFS
jgi:hypothetical protein